MSQRDVERHEEVQGYLDSVQSTVISGFTVGDLRHAILVTIRQDRHGEEPGHYAFPGVPAEELANFATLNLLRQFEEKARP